MSIMNEGLWLGSETVREGVGLTIKRLLVQLQTLLNGYLLDG